MLKIKSIKPMHTKIVTTAERYGENATANGIILKTVGSVKEYQKVIAVGDTVKCIKPGDLVCIDPTRFAVKKHSDNSIKTDIEGGNPILEYRFDIVEMDGKKCLLLQDRDIQFIIEDYEVIEEPKYSNIITPPKDVII